MGPEDRQFPEFFASQEHPEAYARKVLVNRHRSLLRRLRLEARHAGRDRAEAPDPGPHEELLVVREAIRRGGPPGAPGVRADPAQGLKVDQSTTRGYYRFGQPWLVISPGGRSVSTGDDRRITVYTAVTPPSQYPGKPVKGHDDLGGQSFSTLSGRRSSGRRPDGRASTMGDQGGVVGYLIAWPYRCEPPDHQRPPADRGDGGRGAGPVHRLRRRRPAGRPGDQLRRLPRRLPLTCGNGPGDGGHVGFRGHVTT